MNNVPKGDESFILHHRAVWSIGVTASAGPMGLTWLVYGTRRAEALGPPDQHQLCEPAGVGRPSWDRAGDRQKDLREQAVPARGRLAAGSRRRLLTDVRR